MVEHGQVFGVDDELFVGGGEAAFEPADGVHDEVGVALHRRPQVPHCFVCGLGVGRVGAGQAAAAAGGQFIAAGELGAGKERPGAFGGAKGGAAAFHVDVGGEAAVDDGYTRVDQLGEGYAGQHFGVLLGQGCGHCHRTHGAGKDEGRDEGDLPGASVGEQAAQHAVVVAQRAVDVDDITDDRVTLQVAEDDARHFHAVGGDFS